MQALIDLYEAAAEAADTDDECGFFLTHAYVFSLVAGGARSDDLKARLIAMGRDVP